MKQDRDLEGKTAIVTGASSGIGTAIAEAMADAGAAVALVGRDRERLEAVAQAIGGRGGRTHIVARDVTADDAPKEIIDAALEAFGPVDSIVHSAGIFWPKPFLETPLSDLDRQWEVNVRAPFALTQAALPHMKAGSTVIFISSIAGYIGFPNSSAYCATKGAVELLTRALAVELAAQSIRVNCIAPGNIATSMNEHLLADPDYCRAMIEATPSRSIGKAEEIAPMAVFLASDKASFMVGSSVLIDGGWCAA